LEGRKEAFALCFEILNWAVRTARADLRSYNSSQRSISMDRFYRSIVPSLHRPIFLIGAPRSGTSFLGRCLASLAELSYHYEPIATKSAARLVYEGKWHSRSAQFFYRQVYSWLMRIHLDGDRRFAEKTPRNCFLIEFLHRTFPDASFIHIIRDGRDAALSYSKKPWLQMASADSGERESSGYFHGPYARFWVESDRIREFEMTSDIHRCIWAWRRHVEAALTASHSLPPQQYYEIRYEDLATQPRLEAERLLEYIEISEPTSCKSFHESISHASPNSIGKWRHELTKIELDQIMEEAGSLLRDLGYT
jgi:hypothetical protein